MVRPGTTSSFVLLSKFGYKKKAEKVHLEASSLMVGETATSTELDSGSLVAMPFVTTGETIPKEASFY